MNISRLKLALRLVVFYFISTSVLSCPLCFAQTGWIDSVEYGNSPSELAHKFRTENGTTEIVSGQFGYSPRRITAPSKPNWAGTSMFVTLKTDPERANYLTFKFWGEDTNPNTLCVFINGKQLGYRHLGDYDILHHGTDTPVCRGQFYYITTLIPEEATRGKEKLEIEVRLFGRLWGYGANFDQFQKNIEGSSLPIYAVYTHRNATFIPEKTESISYTAPARPAPGAEVLDKVKQRISHELSGRLNNSKKILTQQDIEFLAKGYRIKWSSVYNNPKCVEKIFQGIDSFYLEWQENPRLIKSDPRQYNGDWFGVAPLSEAIVLIDSPEFQTRLEESIPLKNGGQISRRLAWSEMIFQAMDFLARHRRWYTNQTMIIDWNIYRMNRALRCIAPERAFTEKRALRYLYEAMGIQPWRGADTDTGSSLPRAEAYYQFTPKGLSRELGYVGIYGEILDWGCLIYLATCNRDADGQLIVRPDGFLDGDDAIRLQLTKMTQARQYFRYSQPDSDGYKAMRLERAVGWRDNELIGPIVYCARSGKEGVSIMTPFCTRDIASLAQTKQMLDDNQFFHPVDELTGIWSLRVSNAIMYIPEHYDFIQSQLARNNQDVKEHQFPMADAAPDFVFSDETNGVLVLKSGDDRLYVSLYWRARLGVNRLAKVHYIGKHYQQYVIMREEQVEFSTDGQTWKRKNWTTADHSNGYGHIHYPVRFESLHTDEILPIATIPSWDKEFLQGKENGNAGRADFYRIRWGEYIIAMNCSSNKTFELDLSEQPGTRFVLLPTETEVLHKQITIEAQKTVVIKAESADTER